MPDVPRRMQMHIEESDEEREEDGEIDVGMERRECSRR